MNARELQGFSLTPEDMQKMVSEATAPLLSALKQFRTGLKEVGVSDETADRMCEQFFAMMLGQVRR